MDMDRNISAINGTHQNILSPDDMRFSSWLMAVQVLKSVCIPVIVTVGFVGNTLSLLVFSARSMKNSSCSVFLAALAAVDNLFLLSLLISWIDGEINTILKSSMACQLLVYLTYTTSFLSSWFIVGFTCERFIAICFPFRSSYLCTVFREKVTVCILILVALVLYNFSFWTTDAQHLDINQAICFHKIEYFKLLHVFTWIDTCITMFIPFLIIICVNSLVLRAVAICPLTSKSRSRISRTTKVSSYKETDSPKYYAEHTKMLAPRQRYNRTKSLNPQARVTRTLLFVSTTFLVLNLPAHVMRLYNLISSVTSDIHKVSWELYFLQEITSLLYYSTFSCNFVLYTLFGRNFKTSLCLILRCKSTKRNRRRHEMARRHSSARSLQGTCVTSL